jgi:hypothetical protein
VRSIQSRGAVFTAVSKKKDEGNGVSRVCLGEAGSQREGDAGHPGHAGVTMGTALPRDARAGEPAYYPVRMTSPR